MTVDFYRDNEQKAPTVENYLFTDYYALMIDGQRIDHELKTYQVTGQLWNDDDRKLLNVFLWEYPATLQPISPVYFTEEL